MTLTAAPATRPAPAEPTTPIRPSEAIRLGCLIAPMQAFGVPGSRQTACVMRAMDLATNGNLNTYFALASAGPFVCPDCGMASVPGWSIGVHLNDDHRWSRERIADWLEGLGL